MSALICSLERMVLSVCLSPKSPMWWTSKSHCSHPRSTCITSRRERRSRQNRFRKRPLEKTIPSFSYFICAVLFVCLIHSFIHSFLNDKTNPEEIISCWSNLHFQNHKHFYFAVSSWGRMIQTTTTGPRKVNEGLNAKQSRKVFRRRNSLLRCPANHGMWERSVIISVTPGSPRCNCLAGRVRL